MAKITVIIITKNSEEIIEECLSSVKFADEIIIIDAYSTDNTTQIANKFNTRVFKLKNGNFSDQRNKGLELAENEWILYVDADERVTSSLREEIIQYTNNPIMQYSSFKIGRKNFYYGMHEWPYVENILRLFHKTSIKKWEGILHESPVVEGEVGNLKGYLFHYSHQDLFNMVDKTNQWSKIEAELRFNSKHPKMKIWRFFRVMLTAYYNSFISQYGWKAGKTGIVESIYQSFSIFITYSKLWEMQTSELMH